MNAHTDILEAMRQAARIESRRMREHGRGTGDAPAKASKHARDIDSRTMTVLGALHRGGPIGGAALAARLEESPEWLFSRLSNLLRRGIVARDATIRRKPIWSITDAGVAILKGGDA